MTKPGCLLVTGIYLENEILKAKAVLYRELLKQSRDALEGAAMALAEQDSCEGEGIRAMIRALDKELEDDKV